MASVWLLPVVTLIVASSSGGLLASALVSHSEKLALLTTAFSFIMLAIGLTLALMIITIYLQRLVLYGPPDVNLILSAFVVLGPLGQGGYSLLVNGDAMFELLPKVHMGSIFIQPSVFAQIIYGVCLCGSWILWYVCYCTAA
jgi:tellurite resistance protein TehA-like permease